MHVSLVSALKTNLEQNQRHTGDAAEIPNSVDEYVLNHPVPAMIPMCIGEAPVLTALQAVITRHKKRESRCAFAFHVRPLMVLV
jgi:hypothetical protein